MNQKLTNLNDSIKTSFRNQKNFTYQLSKKASELNVDNYVDKYIKEITGETNSKKCIYQPGYSNNIILAVAFAKAEKLYSSLVKSVSTKNTEGLLTGSSIVEEIERQENIKGISNPGIGTHTLSLVELVTLSNTLYTKKNRALTRNIKINDLEELKSFQEIEKIIRKALKELRNYHAHIIHQTSPIYFRDAYRPELRAENKLTQAEWDKAKAWFENKFMFSKQSILQRLDRLIEEANTISDRGQLVKVKDKVNDSIFINKNNFLTQDAMLFIACMFLRKSDAHWFINKFTGCKKSEGFFKELHGFFSFYSINDKKSLKIYDENLLMYRKIIGILSTVPVSIENSSRPIYEAIQTNNEFCAKKIIELEKISPSENKSEIEYYKSFRVPIRKNTNITKYLLQYLWDNNLLRDIEVAINKTAEKRVELQRELGLEETTLFELKNEIKRCTDELQKQKLKNKYKILKRSYYFEKKDNYKISGEPAFAIKKKNAIFKIDDIITPVSPDFFMKCVFLHIQNPERKLDIKKEIVIYIEKFRLTVNKRFENVILKKQDYDLLPSSLKSDENISRQFNKRTRIEFLIAHIKNLTVKLENFDFNNKTQSKPWQFESKKKINLILQYNHLKYLIKKYTTLGLDKLNSPNVVNDIRHDGLNEIEFMKVYDLIRAFRTEKEELINYITKEKLTYFEAILPILKSSIRIEEIYEKVITKYLKLLGTIVVNEENKLLYQKIFKINIPPKDTSNLEKIFSNSISIPGQAIELRKYFPSKYTECENKSHKNKGWKYTSDFQIIRNILSENNTFTNTDYILKVIVPKLFKNSSSDFLLSQGTFNYLLKTKTEDLLLYKIGDYYKKKAIEKKETDIKYENITLSFKKIEATVQDLFDVAYQKNNPFYQINNAPITKYIKINGYSEPFKLIINANKFDDEYLYYESTQLGDYISDLMINNIKSGNYVNINKDLKNEISNSLIDIFLLLNAERSLAIEKFEAYWSPYLAWKYSTPDIYPDGYYIKFGEYERANNSRGKWEDIGQVLYKYLIFSTPITWNEFVKYRNKALHQEYFNNNTKNIIRKALYVFCKSKNCIFSSPRTSPKK